MCFVLKLAAPMMIVLMACPLTEAARVETPKSANARAQAQTHKSHQHAPKAAKARRVRPVKH